jgi:hypothetical protein
MRTAKTVQFNEWIHTAPLTGKLTATLQIEMDMMAWADLVEAARLRRETIEAVASRVLVEALSDVANSGGKTGIEVEEETWKALRKSA